MPTSSDTKRKAIQVQVIDPHQITLWGICQLINSNERFIVSSSCTTGEDALKNAQADKPEVIVIEPEMESEDSISLIETLIQKSDSKVMLLTSSNNPVLQDRAILKGARGVVLKSESPDTLLKALEKISQGEMWLNRNATSRILMKAAGPSVSKDLSNEQFRLSHLTPKEEKVTRAIQLYPKKTLREVAETLHISEHTLRNHLASIYDKLGVRNRLELFVFCGKYQTTDDPNDHPRRRATDI